MKVLCSILLLLFLAGSCGVSDDIDDSISNSLIAVDKAIDEISRQSSGWQTTITELTNELIKEGQSTLATEVTQLGQRAINAASQTIRCDMDFIKDRLIQQLVSIKRKLLGQELADLPPSICDVVPLGIDMNLSEDRRNKIDFYGYDFDRASTTIILKQDNSNMDVTQFLTVANPYSMTLNLGGNGLRLGNSSNEIVLFWNNEEISSIPIIQKAVHYCGTIRVPLDPQTLDFRPPQTGQDADFDGNGPKINCTVKIYISGNKLKASVYMKAREVDGGTEAQGTKHFTLYTNTNPNKKISKILTDDESSQTYTDGDKKNDYFKLGNGDLVRSFEFVGDKKGDEAGTRTRVSVLLNPIEIELRDIADCITVDIQNVLLKHNLIDQSTVSRLRSLQSN